MKAKATSIVFAIILAVLIFPGCYSSTRIDELVAKVSELGAHINELYSEIDAKDKRISELETEVERLRKLPGQRAKIEITMNPALIPCEDGQWHWTVILSEVCGVGVKLENVTTQAYIGSRVRRRDYNVAWIEKWLDDAYMPPNSSADFVAGFPCRAIEYEIITVNGIDDNGNQVTAKGRVDFLSP